MRSNLPYKEFSTLLKQRFLKSKIISFYLKLKKFRLFKKKAII